MMRFIRFKNKLNFKQDINSAQAIFMNANFIKDIAIERVTLELCKILNECNSKAIEDLSYFGILDHIIPELEDGLGCEQPPQFHPEGDVWDHTMLTLDKMKEINKSYVTLWAALLHDVGKPAVQTWDEEDKRFRFNNHDTKSAEMAKVILTRLKFSNQFIDHICNLIAQHMKFQNVQILRLSKLKRFVLQDNFQDHLDLHKADCLASHGIDENYEFCKKKWTEFLTEQPEISFPKPIFTGDDLIELGFIPNPKFKEMLDYLMDGQLEHAFTDKNSAIQYLAQKYLLIPCVVNGVKYEIGSQK